MNVKKTLKTEQKKTTARSLTSSIALFKKVSEALNMPMVSVKNVVNKWWEELAIFLKNNHEFTYVGKAKFSVKDQRELVRSPSGQTMVKPKYAKRIKIKPGTNFLREVNGIKPVKKTTKTIKPKKK